MDWDSLWWAVIVPLVIWGAWISSRLVEMGTQLTSLVSETGDIAQMHERTNVLISNNTAAMKELSHYTQWLISHHTGEPAPPPLPEAMKR